MHKVIMAPTEGSDSERPAISVAVKLAQRFDADLHLVRVLTAPLVIETVPRPPVLAITEQTLRDERLARLRKLEALGTECRALGGVRVTTALEDGPVAPALRDYAVKFDVDMMVMSSHSRGGVKRITLGSVTDYLIRRTNIPVLVVKPPASFLAATPEETFSRIVVPVDGSALAEQILPEVAALASQLNSTVSLLRVLTPLTYTQREIMQAGLPWWDNAMVIAVANLARVARTLSKEGLTVSKEIVLSDDVATAILDYSARTSADLIAIATSGAGGMRRFVVGTVADEVTRRSPISLLVFHPKHSAVADNASGRSETRTLADA